MRRSNGLTAICALLLWAAPGGCSSDSNQRPDGGGGGGSGSGGTGRGGSGGMVADAAMMNCGDTSQPIDPTAMIDDMEAPNYPTLMNGGRNGAWWAGGDQTSPGAAIQPDGNADAELIPGGRCGSMYAERVTGHGYMMWAVLSVSMGWGTEADGGQGLLPNDNSFRTGVTFWARIGDTSTNQVRFAISDKYSRPEGGYCVDGGAMDVACYDTFGVDLTQLGTDWKQYRIPFGGLTQRHFGLPRPSLDSSSIYTIEFNFNPSSTFDFWVDDISFY
ncbi:MAG TPA: hypothetical protein VKQ32_00530 [Polyangia bacterium]|nr:hypothetical protein [Polyangia bacterium]